MFPEVLTSSYVYPTPPFKSILFTSLFSGYTTDDDDDGDDVDIGYQREQRGAGSTAKVQYMITNRMRNKLINELGYLPEEIDMLEPQIASVVIERALSRPSSGMPSSWRKTKSSQAPKRSNNNARGGIFKKLQFLLPIAAIAIAFFSSGSLMKLSIKNFDMKKLVGDFRKSKPEEKKVQKQKVQVPVPQKQPTKRVTPPPMKSVKPSTSFNSQKSINVNALEQFQKKSWSRP
jgi:hypothetical protein